MSEIESITQLQEQLKTHMDLYKDTTENIFKNFMVAEKRLSRLEGAFGKHGLRPMECVDRDGNVFNAWFHEWTHGPEESYAVVEDEEGKVMCWNMNKCRFLDREVNDGE